MRRKLTTLLSAVVFTVTAVTAFADNGMMGGPSMRNSTNGANSMTAPNTMGNDSTMQGDTMTADPKVGNMLRFAPSAAHKVIYTSLKAAESFAAKGPSVLFFAADWCPYCQADLRDINEHGSRLGKDITIVVVNYDKVPELKAKYGVTVQDTFVQIDKNGRKLAVWNGGGVDGINSHVVRM